MARSAPPNCSTIFLAASRSSIDSWDERDVTRVFVPFAAATALCARAGVSFAWARLFHLHGEGEPAARLHPSVAADLAAGRVPVLRQPDAVRDYLAVEEAGRMLAMLAARELAGPVNLGSGRPQRLAAIAAEMAMAAGRPDLAAALPAAAEATVDIQVPDLARLRAAGLAQAGT